METLTVTVCLFFGIFFSATLFNFLPTLSKSKAQKTEFDLSLKEELKNISQVLFDADENGFLSFTRINLQGFHNSSNLKEDFAPQPLLLIDEVVYSNEIVKRIKRLYDNFEANSSINENFTADEEIEENDFINQILETAVMKLAFEFLLSKSFDVFDHHDRFQMIKEIWFQLYPRNKNIERSSSGFEHVFLSEIKKGKIIGLHNWIYFAEAEKQGILDYKGWVRSVILGKKAQMVKIKFTLNGLNKSVSSMFIGISPELEIALYTICFKLRPNKDCNMEYDGVKVVIRTYTHLHNGKGLVASAYVNL